MTHKPMSLWVTRTSPFNLLTAQRLRGMGHRVVVNPLFDVTPIEAAEMSWNPDLIAFTSINGVRHHPYQSAWADLPVFAVGDSTAAAAHRCGYRNVRSANGNLQDLQAAILRSAAAGTRLVHFSAREPSGDLAAYLRCRGFDAVRRTVYQTVTRPLEDARRTLAGPDKVDGLIIHSSKSARRAADLMADTGWSGSAFCISRACAAEFEKVRQVDVQIARRPTERSLMHLIRTASGLRANHSSLVRLGRLATIAPVAMVRPLHSANDNFWPEPTPA